MDIYLWEDGDKIRALKKNPNNQPQKQYHNVKPEGEKTHPLSLTEVKPYPSLNTLYIHMNHTQTP